MDRDEIVNLARESGATIHAGKYPGVVVYEGDGNITLEVLERAVNAAIIAEREACAKNDASDIREKKMSVGN